MVLSSRKHVRYKPDHLDVALVMFDGTAEAWNPNEVALIVDEAAMSGAQLVLKFTDLVKPSQKIKVKLGRLEPVLAEVVWRKEVAADLCRIGLKLLE